VIARGAVRAVTPHDIDDLLRAVRGGARTLRSCSPQRFDELIAALHVTWSPGGRFRERCLASAFERGIGLSRPMVEWALDRFAMRLNPAQAFERAAMQLGQARESAAISLRAEPLGVLLLVVSGNVFTGPAEALMAALCTRNAAIVKRPGMGGEFIDLFVESIEEAAPDLAAAVALLSWKGGTDAVEKPLAESVDGIVVAGDGETISAYRRLAPATTPLVEFGPRVSVAIVSRGGIESLAIDRLALDIAQWDQLACSAAQAVYVEGEEAAMSTAARLAEALARLERSLPAGDVSIDERIEMARLRQEAAFAESQGDARVFAASDAVATVVFERHLRFRPSPLGRSVRVIPYQHLDELVSALAPARHLLHTIGLAVASSERAEYEHTLAAAGARRLCAIGSMNEPSAAGAHDGMLELQRLVRWVECTR
jgi:phenylacetate-CoA ligase